MKPTSRYRPTRGARCSSLLDYRLIAMSSDDRKDLPTKEVPTVITHAILFRSEFRW